MGEATLLSLAHLLSGPCQLLWEHDLLCEDFKVSCILILPLCRKMPSAINAQDTAL